jgi:hypothetical protein
MSRSHAKVMANDLLEPPEHAAGDVATVPAITHWGTVPMTEKQARWLADLGVLPDGGEDLTWLEASLLIDRAFGSPDGAPARHWLAQQGATPQQIEAALERATDSLDGGEQHSTDRGHPPTATRILRSELERRAEAGRLQPGPQRILEAVRRWDSRLPKQPGQEQADGSEHIRRERILELEARAGVAALTETQASELRRLHALGDAKRLAPGGPSEPARMRRADERRAYYRQVAMQSLESNAVPEQLSGPNVDPEPE